MKTASAPRSRLALPAYLCTLLAVLVTVEASAVDLSTQKLFGKWTLTPTGYAMGADLNTAALSPKWILLGDAGAAERGQSVEGGVQVFNATTGAFVRKLLPPGAAAADQRFGGAVALAGDIAVAGAYTTNAGQGRAYIYNLATGALLRTLNASDGAANDQFGQNVATNGVIAAIAAPQDEGFQGAVYLFDVATGTQIEKLTAFDGAGAHYYGYGMALEGNILAVGADGNAADRGAVYFYDLSKAVSDKFIKKFQPTGSVAGDHVGAALAMHQGRVVMGNFVGLSTGKVFMHNLATNLDTQITLGGSNASFGGTVAIHGPILAVSEHTQGQGRVHLFKSSDGSFIRTILPPNGDTNPQRFGFAIALDGTKLLATAPDDSVQAGTAGAAHLIGPLTQDMEYTKVIAKGDFAPGAADISYGTISEAFINDGGSVMLTPTLTGAGSNLNRDTAAFADIVSTGRQELLFKSRQTFAPGVLYGAISRISSNDDDLAIGYATLTGTGITAANNQLLWFKTDVATGTLLRTGTAVPEFGGALLAKVPEAVTSNQYPAHQVAAFCTLKVGGATNATNDSGLWITAVGGSSEAKRENDPTIAPLPAGNLGQFAPRVCYHYSQHVYSTALVGTNFTPLTNAAIFRRTKGAAEQLVAQKYDIAVDGMGGPLPNARYSSFIGETADGASGIGGSNGVVYRAALVIGGATNATNNEGLWRLDGDSVRRLILRKGQTLTTPAGLKVARIIHFWATGFDTSDDQVLALVKLSGPGVTSANDQALLLYQSDDSLLLLMREGDPAAGCPGAKIGVISRVEVEPYSSYYALTATLAGAPVGTELALFTGGLTRGNTTNLAPLRLPFLRLRKGQLFDNQPSKIKSLSLPTSNLTASGAGGTGRGRAISYGGSFAFIVEFDNGVRQVMKGTSD